MDKILEFRNKLTENDVNKPKIRKLLDGAKTYGELMYGNNLTTHKFALCSYSNYGEGVGVINQRWNDLIVLDEEDIAYFKRKYLPKLTKEMQSKINAIKEEYKGGIE
jgi:hypothetical protein